jgi:hypothetical protein
MKRSLAGILAAVALVSTVGLTGTAASAAATLKSSGSVSYTHLRAHETG